MYARVCSCVRVCVRTGESERVGERETKRESERARERDVFPLAPLRRRVCERVYVCVYVRVRAWETESVCV